MYFFTSDHDPNLFWYSVVFTGIGFLGAGSIIAHKGHVRGITSAATLWTVAGIGLGVGLGQYFLAILSAVFVFGILQIGRLEKNHLDTTYDK